MRQIDKYYLFINEAVSSPNTSPEYKYFVDTVKQKLLRVSVNNTKCLNNNWEELPKLNFESKKKFIIDFLKKKKENYELRGIAEKFDPESKFDIHNELKLVDNDVATDFYFKSGVFLSKSIGELYSKYNLSENMKVDFAD